MSDFDEAQQEGVRALDKLAVQHLRDSIAHFHLHLAIRRSASLLGRAPYETLRDDAESLRLLTQIDADLRLLFIDPYEIPPKQSGSPQRDPPPTDEPKDEEQRNQGKKPPAGGANTDASSYTCPNCHKKMTVRLAE